MEDKNLNTSEQYIEPVDYKMQYGAPDLKKFYRKFAFGGLILAILLHAFFIASYSFSVYLEEKRKEEELRQRKDVVLKDIMSEQNENEDDNAPPPIEQEVEEQTVIKDLESLNPEPSAKEKAEIQTLKSIEEQVKQDQTLRGREEKEGSDLPSDRLDKGKLEKTEENIKKEEQKEIKKESPDKVYKQFEVDKAPSAVNLGSVRASMRYPSIAQQNGIEGRVTVQVLVGKDGSVVQVGKFSGPDVFRDEVTSKVSNLRFSPAIQQGNPVNCWVTVPFSFTLSQSGFKKDKDKEEEKEEKKEKKEENKEE